MSNVVDVRKRAFRKEASLAVVSAATAGSFSKIASDRVAGSFRAALGYAIDARRNGRGMSSAVSASGRSSNDLPGSQYQSTISQ